MRPALDNIDFFANTLDIRKDAIRPYENYNPQEEGEVMSNLGGSHDDDLQVGGYIFYQSSLLNKSNSFVGALLCLVL